MTTAFDVAVVGLGAMGSAAAAQIAARGLSVIGLEAHQPAHTLSSSHGDSRIIRLGYFEDPSYVPLLRRAYHNWRDLEARLKTDILTTTGVLQIGAPTGKLVAGTLASCNLHGLPHEVLDRAAMQNRFPGFILEDHEVGVLDPNGGYIRPETAIAAFLKAATEDGATLHFGEKVLAIEPGSDGVVIRTETATYRAGKVIVATGAWIAELVPQLAHSAVPIRQVVSWYRPADGFAAQPHRMACFLRDDGENGHFFGFPALGADGVKIGRHCHFREPIDPNAPNRPVDRVDTDLLDDFAARRMPTLATTRLASTTCRYTMLPSEDFLIDLLPGDPGIVVCSACSGHGFKFTSVIGEILADLAIHGGTALPIGAFSFSRHFG